MLRNIQLALIVSSFLVLLQACVPVESVQAGYAHIAAGEYVLGATNHAMNPKRKVAVAAFDIAVHEVTNAQFADFVAATGYVTLAEKRHDAMVFYPGLAEFRWHADSTAQWRYPNGISQGGIDEKMDHPVTCISFIDVEAYCRWAGVRLPTLDEWEVAARAGARSRYFWGNADAKVPRYGNIWHGVDHMQPDTADAWPYTAPVGALASNPHGLYDIYGNVFEFCADKPALRAAEDDIACARGGSWWCSFGSCRYFNNADIGNVRTYASFSNQGFRVVRPADGGAPAQ
jgi:sulfatase modifying factor 1